MMGQKLSTSRQNLTVKNVIKAKTEKQGDRETSLILEGRKQESFFRLKPWNMWRSLRYM